ANYDAQKKFPSSGCWGGGASRVTEPPAIRAPREDAMRQATMRQASMVSALVVMLSFTGPAAHAQSAPQQGSSQDVLAPAPKLNLTLEQRHTIKELVKDMKA